MCLIVDADVMDRVFLTENDTNFGAVRDALYGRTPVTQLVLGGQLTREYSRSPKVVKEVVELFRAGRARRVLDAPVNLKAGELKAQGECKSNDFHILALAIVGKVRLLCTEDNALTSDFNNKRLVDNPRGKVYRKASHKGLIRESCHCHRAR